MRHRWPRRIALGVLLLPCGAPFLGCESTCEDACDAEYERCLDRPEAPEICKRDRDLCLGECAAREAADDGCSSSEPGWSE